MSDCPCSETILSGCGCQCGSFECIAPEPSQGPQGVQGIQGVPGENGSDGINAWTVSTSTFVVPAVGNSVAIPVASGTWAAQLQPIFIENAGEYQVVTSSSTSITAKNLGGSNNATPTTVIATNSKISPSGTVGTLVSPLPIASGGTGQSTAIAAFGALSPLTTVGDTLSYAGGANVRIAAGTSGQILTANGVAVPSWQTNAPAAANITGQVAIANGGTSANTAAGARTALAIPGLATPNNFTESNSFVIGASKQFLVTGSVDDLVEISEASANFRFRDISGTISVDIQNKSLTGAWNKAKSAYTTANGSTFSAWSGALYDIETVISTYSTTGVQSITLPSGVNNRVVRISDGGGLAGTNNITLNRSGSDTIMGSTTFVISNNYGGIALIFVSATTNWIPLP